MSSILPCPPCLLHRGGVWQGEGGWGRGQGTFHPPCHILHYHLVLRPEGTSHNNAHSAFIKLITTLGLRSATANNYTQSVNQQVKTLSDRANTRSSRMISVLRVMNSHCVSFTFPQLGLQLLVIFFVSTKQCVDDFFLARVETVVFALHWRKSVVVHNGAWMSCTECVPEN